jgi:CheY-like chemotaxis protein
MAKMTGETYQPERTDAIRLLVADDDPDILDTIEFIFEDVGYDTTTKAATLEEALECVETGTYSLIITDMFTHTAIATDALKHLAILCKAAYPTPVILMSAWNLTAETVLNAGFAAFVAKPFAIEDLLSTVADVVSQPFTAEQKQQESVLRSFLERLSMGAWGRAVDYCTDDVTYVAPLTAQPRDPVVGKPSYRAYIEETAHAFPRFECTEIRVFALPRGLAARFTAMWGTDSTVKMSAGLAVEFAGDNRIRQIGIQLDAERLRALQNAS